MDLPVDPVRMSVEELLADLQAGFGEAAVSGPEGMLRFLQGTLRDTLDLPPPALVLLYDLLAQTQAELQDWDGCALSLAKAQEERKQVRTEHPAEPPSLPPIPLPEPEFVPLLVRREPPPQEVARPLPVQAPVLKRCCLCGQDVSHKARRKNPGTQTYICNDCFANRQRAEKGSWRRLNQPFAWILAISILALGALVLLKI